MCSAVCLDEAAKRGALSRALRSEIAPNEIDTVRAKLKGQGGLSHPDETKK